MIEEKEIKSFIKEAGCNLPKSKLYGKGENFYTFRFGRNSFLKITYLKEINKYRVYTSNVVKLPRGQQSLGLRVPIVTVYTWNFKTLKPKIYSLEKNSKLKFRINKISSEGELANKSKVSAAGLKLFKRLNGFDLKFRLIQQLHPVLKDFEYTSYVGLSSIVNNFSNSEDLFKYYLLNKYSELGQYILKGHMTLQYLPLIKKLKILKIEESLIISFIKSLNQSGLYGKVIKKYFSIRINSSNKEKVKSLFEKNIKFILDKGIYSLYCVLRDYPRLKVPLGLNYYESIEDSINTIKYRLESPVFTTLIAYFNLNPKLTNYSRLKTELRYMEPLV